MCLPPLGKALDCLLTAPRCTVQGLHAVLLTAWLCQLALRRLRHFLCTEVRLILLYYGSTALHV